MTFVMSERYRRLFEKQVNADFDFGNNVPTYDPQDYAPDVQWMSEQDVDALVVEVQRRMSVVTEYVRQFTKEKINMLPQSGGGASNPTTQKSDRGGLPRLDVSMLSARQEKEFKIQSVRAEEGKFGTQVSLKGSLEGTTVMWYLSIKNNPCYDALVEKFGQEENDWAGQLVLLHIEQDKHTEKWYPRVTFSKSNKPAK